MNIKHKKPDLSLNRPLINPPPPPPPVLSKKIYYCPSLVTPLFTLSSPQSNYFPPRLDIPFLTPFVLHQSCLFLDTPRHLCKIFFVCWFSTPSSSCPGLWLLHICSFLSLVKPPLSLLLHLPAPELLCRPPTSRAHMRHLR